jgi:hypothetical protein
MSPYSPIPPIPDPGLSHPPGRSRGLCPLLAIRPLTTRRQVSMLSETENATHDVERHLLLCIGYSMMLMLKNILRDLAGSTGPARYGPRLFLSPEIVRLSAAFSRLLTCVFSVHTSYYMTWATCGFRWHASGHRLATGMQHIASERSLSVLLLHLDLG